MYNPEILKKLRHENSLTQAQVADHLTMDRSTYAYYETGRCKPSIDTIIKLAHMFQVSLYEILDEQPTAPKF